MPRAAFSPAGSLFLDRRSHPEESSTATWLIADVSGVCGLCTLGVASLKGIV